MDFKDMVIGEDYALALGSLWARVQLLATPADVREKDQALVRFREGARKGERREVSIHDLVYHWNSGRQIARPMPAPRPKPPGVRRKAA